MEPLEPPLNPPLFRMSFVVTPAAAMAEDEAPRTERAPKIPCVNPCLL